MQRIFAGSAPKGAPKAGCRTLRRRSGIFSRSVVLQVHATKFAAAKVFVPDVYDDDRGYFKEAWSKGKYAALDLPTLEWEQDSTSWSTRNVIRGMHYDFRMAKLVQCLHGRIFDAIVDLRRESPTYLQWQGFILSAGNHRQLYVPAGFAHGFIALADEVIVHYKNSVAYDPDSEGAISWRNPRVGIEWPLVGEPRLSAKDAAIALDALP
jgi:dTDP-4-dehydrorhamnose 3,5-epimerase